VEGIGNHLSDIDAYVIAEARLTMSDVVPADHHWIYLGADNNSVRASGTGEIHQIFDYVDPYDIALDTEYWTNDDLAELVDSVKRANLDIRAHGLRAGRISYRDASCIHKLLTGLTLGDTTAIDRFRSEIDVAALCYVLYRQYAGGYPALRDIAGAWYADQYDLAVFSTREHVYDQMMSLTFLEMQTNPNPKWLFDKAAKLRGASADVGRVFQAFNALPTASASEKRAYVTAGLDLIDRIFGRNREILEARWSSELAELKEAASRDRAERHGNQEFERQILYRMKMYESGLPSCLELLHQHDPSVRQSRVL
jgi:hypothetical protein